MIHAAMSSPPSLPTLALWATLHRIGMRALSTIPIVGDALSQFCDPLCFPRIARVRDRLTWILLRLFGWRPR